MKTSLQLLLALLGCSAVAGQEPIVNFRSRGDVVPVYVSVRSGGSVVRGMTAKDFELKDNGVVQEIDSVSSDAVPIDVTLVVDTSSSVINSLSVFKNDVGRIADLLRPDEQLRVIIFDTDVRQISPMQPAGKRPPVAEIRLGEYTSLNDALLFALARAKRPDRRHLVFVFTDGYDTTSLIGHGALPEIASRADGALLHVVLVKSNELSDARSSRELSLLSEAAVRTGGAVDPPRSRDDLVASFEQAIEAFRLSYVVAFAPKGPPKEGWHTLAVRVIPKGSYDVRARQGYYVR